jgi:CheY-like chemotaxis protein
MTDQLRFLLVDDDKDDRDLFASILRETSPGIIITAVADGTEAVSYLETCPELYLPHAMVLDYNMPQMSGAQVLDWICNKPKYFGLAKFILSTSSQTEYKDGCAKKGAIEYFVKPNDVERIRSIAEEIVAFCSRIARLK